jgi:signal transduction histidine kinase
VPVEREPRGGDAPRSQEPSKDAAHEAASLSHAPAEQPQGARVPLYKRVNFRQRVALSFAVVSLITTLLFVAVLSVVWNEQFRTYTRTTMDELATSVATSLARTYNLRGYWNTSMLEAAASNLVDLDGVGIQILDAGGVPIYDSTVIATTSGLGLADDISLAPGDDDAQTLSKPIIANDGQTVGTVRVWVYGSDLLLTQRDMSFRDSSVRAMALVSLAAIVLSLVLGLLFSRKLTQPVRTISATAQRLKEGDLTARSNVRGSDDVGRLGETFDEMAESIERDRELERRLTSDVAHELRTPLMSILATVEAMQDEVLPCDQEHLALVASETKRLSRLVDGMLRLSRLENGSVRFKMEPVDVVRLAGDIAASQRALLADMGLEMEFQNLMGADSLTAELDRDTMTQAITNILSNAMRYTPAPGTITVRVSQLGDEAAIAVSDTGIGIAEKDIDRVFGRFWRAEESRNRVAGGLGVGLALTKEIIDHHHGHIDVESQQGVGTTFTLRVPLRQPRIGGHGIEGHDGY